MVTIRESSTGVTFAVKVQPRARKNAITGVVGDALKLALTAPPIEGRANDAVIRFFADFFEIPRSSVTIASGARGRRKVIRVKDVSKQAIEDKLAENLRSEP